MYIYTHVYLSRVKLPAVLNSRFNPTVSQKKTPFQFQAFVSFFRPSCPSKTPNKLQGSGKCDHPPASAARSGINTYLRFPHISSCSLRATLKSCSKSQIPQHQVQETDLLVQVVCLAQTSPQYLRRGALRRGAA